MMFLPIIPMCELVRSATPFNDNMLSEKESFSYEVHKLVGSTIHIIIIPGKVQKTR